MAFTQPSVVTNNISSLDPEPNDAGGLTNSQLQALFDKFGVDFQTWFNATHLVELAGTTASANIGAEAPVGLTGTTVQEILDALQAGISASALGQIPDGALTINKFAFTPTTTVVSAVQPSSGEWWYKVLE